MQRTFQPPEGDPYIYLIEKRNKRYSPNVGVEDLQALRGTLPHKHHPAGKSLRDEVEFYARDLQSVGVC